MGDLRIRLDKKKEEKWDGLFGQDSTPKNETQTSPAHNVTPDPHTEIMQKQMEQLIEIQRTMDETMKFVASNVKKPETEDAETREERRLAEPASRVRVR